MIWGLQNHPVVVHGKALQENSLPGCKESLLGFKWAGLEFRVKIIVSRLLNPGSYILVPQYELKVGRTLLPTLIP